ncbi:MAG: hypothetical protein DWQ34_04850 [Planctomycetota bacterium]|nr:MAG: hypothetical protein DWQ34_04850 [Planctomycetota bacterium]REK31079.1 MAG: hypothetical protein DWQ41_01250 [Planctomycetota bacterium]REK36807.1 MAG: hypothetical protein DWQ45_09370 [Planctomycetota bacterium]
MLRTQFRLASLAILLSASIQQASLAQDVAVPPPATAALAPPPAANPNVYPRLNAPLYPSPVQYTPPWTGGTIITNQALAPHEMLYPHEYNAMYGPFFYEVDGHWVVTPGGVRQSERWKLQGTRVKVKYRSHPSLFSRIMSALR